MNLTIWNEHVDERRKPEAARIYPDGIHEAIAAALRSEGSVRTATLEEPDHGLPPDVLDATDVLLWWGHSAHDEVSDDVAARVHDRVLDGMGLVVLHSARASKPFVRLMGARCTLRWREAGDREVVWTVAPAIRSRPAFRPRSSSASTRCTASTSTCRRRTSWSSSARSPGARCSAAAAAGREGGAGSSTSAPGHETHPVYHQPEVQGVLANAVRWARPAARRDAPARDSVRSPRGWFEPR